VLAEKSSALPSEVPDMWGFMTLTADERALPGYFPESPFIGQRRPTGVPFGQYSIPPFTRLI